MDLPPKLVEPLLVTLERGRRENFHLTATALQGMEIQRALVLPRLAAQAVGRYVNLLSRVERLRSTADGRLMSAGLAD